MSQFNARGGAPISYSQGNASPVARPSTTDQRFRQSFESPGIGSSGFGPANSKLSAKLG